MRAGWTRDAPGGHGNATARTIAIREGLSVPERGLTQMLATTVANDRAGGRRRLEAAVG